MKKSNCSGNLVVRRIMVLLVLVTLILICPVGVGQTAQEVKLGYDVGLTGPASPWGKRAWNSLQLILDEFNAKGGIKSMGGAKIKYIMMDHQSKPDIAGSNAEKLIKDGVSVMMDVIVVTAPWWPAKSAQGRRSPLSTTMTMTPWLQRGD